MFISRIRSTGKNGRSYVSILLRESKRTGKKVASRTLAILTDLPQWLIAIVENAVEKGKEAASIEQLVAASNSKLGFRSAESFGAVFLVHEVAKACQIPAALGSSHEAKLALWQVCARALSPATSLLAMIRLASRCAASSLLGFRQSFNEDDLYANGSWVTGQQAKIEKKLWLSRPAQPSKSMFLYDVTSSYFEGEHNALAAFGYNRDKVKGKRQVVMGLLTDAEGEPASVSLFPGNTSDLQTFGSQVEKLKTHFGQEHITMVGDRGMIRGPQQVQTKEAGFHFISGLHKAEIETLLKNGTLQMSLFDNKVAESVLADGRRVVTRCNPVRRQEMTTAREGFRARMELWVAQAGTYLVEHPKARVATQMKNGLLRLRRGNLHAWMQLKVDGRTLSLAADEKLLQEHSKLDGCYAVVSDLPVEVADSQELHDRYKDLAKVESGFRTLKHGHLEIRPWYVTSEENTRAHAFTAMLALKIRLRLQSAWEPLNMTVEEGLAELTALSVMEVYEPKSGKVVCRQIPEPSRTQGDLLAALGVVLPTKIGPAGPDVATRVKLNKRRKSAATS